MVVRVGGAVSVVILASSCGSWALAAEPKPLDVAAIRLELRQSWESLRGLQFRFVTVQSYFGMEFGSVKLGEVGRPGGSNMAPRVFNWNT